MRLRAFFSFYGGKHLLAPKYPKPEHKVIIEPFAGSAGYSTLHHERDVILYDADPVIFGIWDYLIHASKRDIDSLPLQFESTEELNICQEAKWLIGFRLGIAATKPIKKAWAWARGEKPGHPSLYWGQRARDRIANQIDYIRHWKVKNLPYHQVENEQATWFIDPPYNCKAGNSYRFKVTNYNELGVWCKQRSGQTVVCENEGADWLDFEPLVRSYSANGRSKSKSSIEMIWTNNIGTAVPKPEQGSSDEIGYVDPKKLVSSDGKPIDPAICQVQDSARA